MLQADLIAYSRVSPRRELRHYVLRAEVSDVAAAHKVWLDHYDARLWFTRPATGHGVRIQRTSRRAASSKETIQEAAFQQRVATAFRGELVRALKRLRRGRRALPVVAWEPLLIRSPRHVPTNHLRFLLQSKTPYRVVRWKADEDELRTERTAAQGRRRSPPSSPQAVLGGRIESAGTARNASLKVTLELKTPEENPFHRKRLWSKTLTVPSTAATTAR